MIETTDDFHRLASGSVRPLDWRVAVSFTKERNKDISWFTLNKSMLGGPDLLAEDTSTPIQDWDAYDYQDVSERLIGLDISRSLDFPYNVQSAIADFELNNSDGYLSISGAGGSSPLSQYILPMRPCRLYLGFRGGGVLPQFAGQTQDVPEYSGLKNERVSFTAMDFLTMIGDMKINGMVMMRDARTDEVIAEVLKKVGLRESMFDLKPGKSVIPFVYFESGKSAGNALRELVQAENGAMWLDEKGVVRFEPRLTSIGRSPVLVLDEDNIVSVQPGQMDNLVNSITISAEIRRIADRQPVFSGDNSYGYQSDASEDHYRVPANGTAEIWLNFDDPVWTVEKLRLNGEPTRSNYTVVNLNGDRVNSGVSVEGELFATSYKLTVVNTNAHPVSIFSIQLWGLPAKMVGDRPVEYQAQDEDSVNKYGSIEMRIEDNKCFGSVENARQYAEDVLSEYSEYSNTIEVSVKGNPALQLQDFVHVSYPGYIGNYVVKGIDHKLSDARLETTLTLHKTALNIPFTLDVSLLDGPDLLT